MWHFLTLTMQHSHLNGQQFSLLSMANPVSKLIYLKLPIMAIKINNFATAPLNSLWNWHSRNNIIIIIKSCCLQFYFKMKCYTRLIKYFVKQNIASPLAKFCIPTYFFEGCIISPFPGYINGFKSYLSHGWNLSQILRFFSQLQITGFPLNRENKENRENGE